MFLSTGHNLSAADSVDKKAGGCWRPLLIASAACCLVAGAASAAEYEFKPSLKARLSKDENLLLNREGREVETFLFVVTPGIQISRSTEKWQAALDLSLSAERLGDDEFDSDNQNLTFQLIRQAETVQFQLVALNDRVNTRVDQLDELGEVDFDVDRRDRQYIRPGLTWTLNQKNRLAFGVSGENVHFGGLLFSDYDNFSADIAWTHQYDEKTQLNLSTFAADYSAVTPTDRLGVFDVCDSQPDNDAVLGLGVTEQFGSETVGVQLGGSRQPTSRLNLRGSLGYRSIKNINSIRCFILPFPFGPTEVRESSGTSDGFILDLGATYQGEKYGLDLSLTRSVSPIGLGFLTERDNFKLALSYRYTERLTGNFLINGFSTQSIDDGFNFDQEGFRVSPGINWRISQKFSLNGGIIYRTAESFRTEGERDGFSTYIGFNYNFKPVRFTR